MDIKKPNIQEWPKIDDRTPGSLRHWTLSTPAQVGKLSLVAQPGNGECTDFAHVLCIVHKVSRGNLSTNVACCSAGFDNQSARISAISVDPNKWQHLLFGEQWVNITNSVSRCSLFLPILSLQAKNRVLDTIRPLECYTNHHKSWLVVSNIFYFPQYMGFHPSHWFSYFSRWLKPQPESVFWRAIPYHVKFNWAHWVGLIELVKHRFFFRRKDAEETMNNDIDSWTNIPAETML